MKDYKFFNFLETEFDHLEGDFYDRMDDKNELVYHMDDIVDEYEELEEYGEVLV